MVLAGDQVDGGRPGGASGVAWLGYSRRARMVGSGCGSAGRTGDAWIDRC
jgi:hypothetical protein